MIYMIAGAFFMLWWIWVNSGKNWFFPEGPKFNPEDNNPFN